MTLPLQQCSGRSFFVIKDAFSDITSPGNERLFSFRASNGAPSGAAPTHDLPIRDLRSGGLASFRLLADGHHREDPLGRRPAFCLNL